jgi:hypothetical protein
MINNYRKAYMIHKILLKKDLQKPQLIITLNMIMEIFIEKNKITNPHHMGMDKIHTNQVRIIMELK